MMSLPVWLAGPMFLWGLGVSVSGPMFRGGGGISWTETPGQRPLYSKERVVRILLECILVEYLKELTLKPPNVTSSRWVWDPRFHVQRGHYTI